MAKLMGLVVDKIQVDDSRKEEEDLEDWGTEDLTTIAASPTTH